MMLATCSTCGAYCDANEHGGPSYCEGCNPGGRWSPLAVFCGVCDDLMVAGPEPFAGPYLCPDCTQALRFPPIARATASQSFSSWRLSRRGREKLATAARELRPLDELYALLRFIEGEEARAAAHHTAALNIVHFTGSEERG